MAGKSHLRPPKHVFDRLYTYLCDFEQFLENQFFSIFWPQKKILSFSEIKIRSFMVCMTQITPEINEITLNLFPKSFPPSSNEYFKIYLKKSIFWKFQKNDHFFSSVVFVVFVAFWGTTMLFFQKYDISAFIGTKNH